MMQHLTLGDCKAKIRAAYDQHLLGAQSGSPKITYENCAIGHCLDEDVPWSKFEGLSVESGMAAEYLDMSSTTRSKLMEIQCAHDNWCKWQNRKTKAVHAADWKRRFLELIDWKPPVQA